MGSTPTSRGDFARTPRHFCCLLCPVPSHLSFYSPSIPSLRVPHNPNPFSSMGETCNSRSLSWLVRSCMPDPNPINPEPRRLAPAATSSPDTTSLRILRPSQRYHPSQFSSTSSDLPSLPDDLLIECLSRVPLSSLPSLSLVCRRFSLLLDSPAFLHRRRSHGLLRRSIFAISLSDIGLLSSASHPAGGDGSASWESLLYPLPLPSEILDGSTSASFSHARLAAVGRSVYILGRAAASRYDTWTESVSPCSPTLFTRKKFAAASIGGKIYIAGGAARTAAVEEYDPLTDMWRVVAEAPRRRYGCVGAGAGGVFYVIGGLKIGGRGEEGEEGAAAWAGAAHVYASSMDAYDVRTGAWLRTRAVPGGGCVVGACAAGGQVYVLASHAVEVSFWRWEAAKGRRGVGEWARLRSPPVPGQVRVGGALRFTCVGVGESSVVVMMHVSESATSGYVSDVSRRMARIYHSNGNGRNNGWTKEGVVLLYDIGYNEWSRGADLPAAFRRAACVCVEC